MYPHKSRAHIPVFHSLCTSLAPSACVCVCVPLLRSSCVYTSINSARALFARASRCRRRSVADDRAAGRVGCVFVCVRCVRCVRACMFLIKYAIYNIQHIHAEAATATLTVCCLPRCLRSSSSRHYTKHVCVWVCLCVCETCAAAAVMSCELARV